MEETYTEIKHSKRIIMSYGFGKFLQQFILTAFASYAFFFYESELGLASLLTGLGYVIFAIWNAINDPIVGYLTNRPFKFTKKWGRRFPWILFGGIPFILSYILIFAPPNLELGSSVSRTWTIFFWLVISTCIFDTFGSIWLVNLDSLYPEKFSSIKERRKVSQIATPIGIVGIALGSILPPLFVEFNNLSSYITQAVIVVIVCFITFSLSIPGSRDDRECTARYLAYHKKNPDQDSFVKAMKKATSLKNFRVIIIVFLLYQFLTSSMTASIPYLTRFILGMEAEAMTLIMVGFLVSAIISIPFWIKIANRLNDNRKVMLIAGLGLAIATAPLIFLRDYILVIISVTTWGIFLGGFWAIYTPVLAEAIDESVVKFKKREEGIFNGVLAFFGRIAVVLQALSFAIIHVLTGFIEEAPIQSNLAIWGIQIHFALLPMIAMFLGMVIFWKWFDLRPDKVIYLKKKMKELNI